MKALAVVVTYNGMKWYNRCFSSLRTSSIPVDIFVADNASSDGTSEYIKTNFPDIIFYESNVNLGFGQANNKGMRYALDNKYDFVFLLNQDAWLANENTIENLINAYQNNQQFGIISPIHLYGSGAKITKEMRMHLAKHPNTDSDIFSDLYFKKNLAYIYEVDYVCAAAWLIPRETIYNIGGFDPIFFHYGEDDNYLQRIVYHGYKIGICPFASICHDIETRGDEYGKQYNYWGKNFLVKLGDVNTSLSLGKNIFQYFYFSIIKLLTFNLKSSRGNFMVATFIMRNKSGLKKSRHKNIQKSHNWL